MALLENSFALAATASLIIQIVVLVMLVYGYLLKRRQKFRQHGITMFSAVVLHAITIFAIMVPSFISGFSSPESINFANMIVVLALVHGAAGIIAFLLGIWLAGSWHLQLDLKPCFSKKLQMRVTITIWMIALFLGITLYWLFYSGILLS